MHCSSPWHKKNVSFKSRCTQHQSSLLRISQFNQQHIKSELQKHSKHLQVVYHLVRTHLLWVGFWKPKVFQQILKTLRQMNQSALSFSKLSFGRHHLWSTIFKLWSSFNKTTTVKQLNFSFRRTGLIKTSFVWSWYYLYTSLSSHDCSHGRFIDAKSKLLLHWVWGNMRWKQRNVGAWSDDAVSPFRETDFPKTEFQRSTRKCHEMMTFLVKW